MKLYFIYFLSIALFITGIHRLILKDDTLDERRRIFPELPFISIYLIPIFEILTSFLIWTKYRNIVLYTWIISVLLIILSILCRKNERENVIKTYKDVFTFKSTTTSIVLHLFWILIMFYVCT